MRRSACSYAPKHSALIRQAAFLVLTVFMTLGLWLWGLTNLVPSFGGEIWAYSWLAIFCWLCIGLSYMIAISVVAIIARGSPPILPEAESLSGDVHVAILYCVRNEPAGTEWGINAYYSMQNALDDGVQASLWILSNSTIGSEAQIYEEQLARELQRAYGDKNVGYFHTGLKEDLKHVRIAKWLRQNQQYKYLVPCDIDTRLPKGFLAKLLRKAVHPENCLVAVFQSELRVFPRPTRFAEYLGWGQEFSQRAYINSYQWLFGRSIFFGSGALLRRDLFEQILVPDNILSHDLYETALLDLAGCRTVYCPDVYSEESFPSTYLEAIRRHRRWTKGVMQIWYVPFKRKLTVGTRAMLGMTLYYFVSQPLFLLWVFLGLLASMHSDALWAQHRISLGILVVMLLTHRLVVVRNVQETCYLLRETMFLLCFNTLVHGTHSVLTSYKTLEWRTSRIASAPSSKDCIYELWPTTLLGLAGLALGMWLLPTWCLSALPILGPWMLAVPLTLYTSKPLGDSRT